MSNNPKPGYKLTELGEIPEEWQVVRFGEVILVKLRYKGVNNR